VRVSVLRDSVTETWGPSRVETDSGRERYFPIKAGRAVAPVGNSRENMGEQMPVTPILAS
jgi:hypothetical protein